VAWQCVRLRSACRCVECALDLAQEVFTRPFKVFWRPLRFLVLLVRR